ncbi:MAG: hypothetical protein EPN75_08760 [Beijerinckiaceae bacterium]|nr:MAG: hypothetical protein EPN75_08760 [Beijerinckiaceae bacterium]
MLDSLDTVDLAQSVPLGSLDQFIKPQKPRKRRAKGDGYEFYPTELWVTLALLERFSFRGPIWECCCGDGELAYGLRLRGYDVIASDLIDRGYGTPGIDFLTKQPKRPFGSIITNPPYKDAAAFVARARQFPGVMVAMYMPLSFCQGAKRTENFWPVDPPDLIVTVADRATMYPRGQEGENAGMMATAWYIWAGGPPKPGYDPRMKWLRGGSHKRYAEPTNEIRKILLERYENFSPVPYLRAVEEAAA